MVVDTNNAKVLIGLCTTCNQILPLVVSDFKHKKTELMCHVVSCPFCETVLNLDSEIQGEKWVTPEEVPTYCKGVTLVGDGNIDKNDTMELNAQQTRDLFVVLYGNSIWCGGIEEIPPSLLKLPFAEAENIKPCCELCDNYWPDGKDDDGNDENCTAHGQIDGLQNDYACPRFNNELGIIKLDMKYITKVQSNIKFVKKFFDIWLTQGLYDDMSKEELWYNMEHMYYISVSYLHCGGWIEKLETLYKEICKQYSSNKSK